MSELPRVPIDELVRKLRAFPASAFDKTEAILSLLEKMPIEEASLALYLSWDRQHYTRNLIDKTVLNPEGEAIEEGRIQSTEAALRRHFAGEPRMRLALVAVARKLAVLLHAMWRRGQPFVPLPQTSTSAVA
jgi:hypothetical protein